LELPKITGVDTHVLIGAKPDDGMRFDPEWFNGDGFANETGFKPKFSFSEAVLKYIEYIANN
jgi:hypothetical protein